MAEIIQFRRKANLREEAINRLALRLMGHLSTSLYARGILEDVPLVEFVDHMKRSMLAEQEYYEVEILDIICQDEKYLNRIEVSFYEGLIRQGYVVGPR